MNFSKKPDSVYWATENDLNKPSTLFDSLVCVSVSLQLRRFDVWVRIFISFRPAHNPENNFKKKNTFVGMKKDQGDVGGNQPEGCRHSFPIFSYARWFILSQDGDETSQDLDKTQLKTRFWQFLGEDAHLVFTLACKSAHHTVHRGVKRTLHKWPTMKTQHLCPVSHFKSIIFMSNNRCNIVQDFGMFTNVKTASGPLRIGRHRSPIFEET